MAVFAGQAGRYMVHRFELWRHPSEGLTVVAARTTGGDASVFHYARNGKRSSVTSGTGLGRWQMAGRHRGQVGHQEGRGRGMAGRAIRAGRHVRCQCIFLGFGYDAHRIGDQTAMA